MPNDTQDPAVPFWRSTPLEAMSEAQWESLCDGCGRCCLVRLVDADTGAFHTTSVGCRLLDAEACRCRDYAARQARVPDCVRLTPEGARLPWLPRTCAYRLIAEGRDLPGWHPLVTGDPGSTRAAGAGVNGRVTAGEDEVAEDDLVDRLVRWPDRWPRPPRAAARARGRAAAARR